MKTPTRILVGGPEVTSAFVLMGLALARGVMMKGKVNVARMERSESGTLSACEMSARFASLHSGYDSRNDRKLKAMRRSGSGKTAPLSAQSAELFASFRWDCR